MILDELSCVMGFLACMVLYAIFALTNFFLNELYIIVI